MIPLIAKAIEKADKSYFFENYTEQAASVLEELKKAGFVILPLEPNEEMINAGVASIFYGRNKPSAIVKEIYTTMVSTYKKDQGFI